MMQDKLIPYSTSLKHNMDIEHENWKFGNNPYGEAPFLLSPQTNISTKLVGRFKEWWVSRGYDDRSKKANGAAGVGVWKEIMKESEWCWENLAFLVGKGFKIKFWKDSWCTGTPLSQCFNHLFVLAAHRDATIEEMDLLHTLRGHRPSLEDDSVMWRQGRNGLFRVKEAYRLLDKPNATVFPARRIWVDRVPTKVCFFAWEATWGKVLTLDRLQIRGTGGVGKLTLKVDIFQEEEFLQQFVNDAYACSVKDRKNYVSYKHIASAVSKCKRFDFLSDFVPERVSAEKALAERSAKT
ncbi:hypothetical protein CK203_025983 [Vitis vinifera]|uniref:Reverse transcriptase zinc-binding domain-containing protein n=1 Tax=Vitis vinifera TaxID=29760 RepID=A0A438IKI7_VITVI|nr:hypothetical protein CK203_025983 [Vitis vinifera]